MFAVLEEIETHRKKRSLLRDNRFGAIFQTFACLCIHDKTKQTKQLQQAAKATHLQQKSAASGNLNDSFRMISKEISRSFPKCLSVF